MARIMRMLTLIVASFVLNGSGQRCRKGNQDIVFIVDRSGSIRDQNPEDGSYDNWDLLKQFINTIIDQLTVGQDRTRIGLVAFATQTQDIFFLNEFQTKKEIQDEVSDLKPSTGHTNTQAGLRKARTEQLTEEHGDRPDAPNVCIVITDGKSTVLPNNTVPEAILTHEAGCSMYAIGITNNTNNDELMAIGIDGFWTSVNFQLLENIVTELTTIQCITEIEDLKFLPACTGRPCASEGCYTTDESSIQVCPCSYDWVSKYCLPAKPIDEDSRTQGNCAVFSVSPSSSGPQIEQVCPNKGPASGGTNVQIWGKGFDGLSRRRKRRQTTGVDADSPAVVIVDFGGNDCKVLTSNATYIECLTSPCWIKNSTNVPEGGLDLNLFVNRTAARVPELFDCLPDPVVTDIHPLETFLEGGTLLTIEGKYLDSVSNAIMEITMTYYSSEGPVNTLFATKCIPDSSTAIMCPTPRIILPEAFRSKRSLPEHMDEVVVVGGDDIRQRAKRQTQVGDTDIESGQKEKLNKPDVLQFYIGLKLDGVPTYINMSKVYEPLGILTVYRNPEVEDFEEDNRIRLFNPGFPDNHDFLDIRGDRLDQGARPESWVIMIGDERCYVGVLSRTTLTCNPPLTQPQSVPGQTRDGALLVTVTVGNLYFTPGYLKYVSGVEVPTILTIAIAVPVALFLLILLIILVVVCVKKQRRWLERLHLQRIADIEKAVRFKGNVSGRTKLLEALSPDVQDTVRGSLIDVNMVEVGDEVASGQFGVVRVGWVTDENGEQTKVAIKTMKTAHPPLSDTLSFIDEAILLSKFKHPHVLTLVGITIKNNVPQIMTPYMTHGDLRGYLKGNDKRLSNKYLEEVCRDVASGMAHLAEMNFVHRDLAARNVMVDNERSVKIADFGLSRDLHSKDYYKPGNDSTPMPVKWMALESLEDGVYNSKTDVWSFGVMMWETMTFGKTPYADIGNLEMRAYLKEENRLRKPSTCSDEIYAIMRSCWRSDPSQRPTFPQLHSKFKNTDRYSVMPTHANNEGKDEERGVDNAGYLKPVNEREQEGYLKPVNQREQEGYLKPVNQREQGGYLKAVN